MKVGIMQPYFLPYLGYWQLINAVDIFVILDDVNYIKKGFINSNSILINNKAHRFTIPLDKMSQNKLIMDLKIKFPAEEREKFLRMIRLSYTNAPYFKYVYPMIEDIVWFEQQGVTEYIFHSIDLICKYLEVRTKFIISSQMEKNNFLKSAKRIIEINQILQASIYINPIGGLELYDKSEFEKYGINLKFLNMKKIQYKQFGDTFVSNLSIIDVLMFNSKTEISRFLEMYEMV